MGEGRGIGWKRNQDGVVGESLEGAITLAKDLRVIGSGLKVAFFFI